MLLKLFKNFKLVLSINPLSSINTLKVTHKFKVTCKYRFCPSCEQKYSALWIEKTASSLINVKHRVVLFTNLKYN